MTYASLISATRAILGAATNGALKTRARNGIKLGIPGFGDSATNRIIWWKDGPLKGRDAAYVPVWVDSDADGEGADALAALIVHAHEKLPALAQGLEYALAVIEAAREWRDDGAADSMKLRAALAHFDAREAEQP